MSSTEEYQQAEFWKDLIQISKNWDVTNKEEPSVFFKSEGYKDICIPQSEYNKLCDNKKTSEDWILAVRTYFNNNKCKKEEQ